MKSPESQVVSMNFIRRDCNDPFLDNGNPSNTRVPLEASEVAIINGEMLDPPARIDVEGFCRVSHATDVSALLGSSDGIPAYRDSLQPFMKIFSGADEVVMYPNCLIRRQDYGSNPDRKNAANYLHADMTASGAQDMEKYLYSLSSNSCVKRVVHFNLWRLLSRGPTNLPLALCDIRSVKSDDAIEGNAYFPAIDRTIGTGFFHPNEHFRFIYYPNLTSNELLIFKQHDSDAIGPSSVPHGAFSDPSAPSDAEPRVSIEARCIARWYH
jgi:hypothetical protein